MESRAVESIFDGIYAMLLNTTDGDQNSYTTGRTGKHNSVLACVPDIGKAKAVAIASNVNAAFPDIKVAPAVGVCAGASQ